MKCPFCNQDNTSSWFQTGRRYQFYPSPSFVWCLRKEIYHIWKGGKYSAYCDQKDQNREQYNRSKIQSGILRACYKRPISIDKIEEMMDAIEEKSLIPKRKRFPAPELVRSLWNIWKIWMQLLMYVLRLYTENLKMSVLLWTSWRSLWIK